MSGIDKKVGVVVSPLTPPRFDVEDEAGYSFLERYGFAVFRDVLTASEVY